MSSYYRVYPITRYYLDPSAPDGLRAVEEPGWCSIFHELRERGDLAGMNHHINICDDCRDFVDRCEEIALANLAATGLQPEAKARADTKTTPDWKLKGITKKLAPTSV